MKISGLVKKALFGGAIVLSTILPNKLNAQTPTWYQAFNPRNEVVDGLNSYGMPDINKDKKLDWADYDLMDSNPSFQTDIDADDNPSSATDKQIFADYLNGLREYLPGEYWRSTPSQKEGWVRNVYPIMTRLNNYEFIPLSDPRSQDEETRFNSDNGSIGDFLSGNGYNPNRDDFNLIYSKYNLNYNGLFNLPIYPARVHSDDGVFNHGISAIFIGTNLNDLEDWLFLELQTGKVIEPRVDWSVPYNSKVYIYGVHDFKSSSISDQPQLVPAARMHINSLGNRDLISLFPEMIEDQSTLAVEDNEYTNISSSYLLQNYPNPFNSTTTIQFTVPQVKTGHALSLQIIIYDITGKEISSLINNINTSG